MNRILPFLRPRPTPAALMINRTEAGGGCVTGLTFIWSGDDGRRCRRCPPGECGLVSIGALGVCNVQVPDFIDDAAAPDFSLTRWRIEDAYPPF